MTGRFHKESAFFGFIVTCIRIRSVKVMIACIPNKAGYHKYSIYIYTRVCVCVSLKQVSMYPDIK